MAHTSLLAHLLPTVIVTTCLCAPALATTASAQELSRQQRELLQKLVTAVDDARSATTPVDHTWLTHVLRASDGSHYLAVSVIPGAAALAERPLLVYVRLATTPAAGVTTLAERSLVREWLQGSRTDPRLLPRRGGMAIGEMPVLGAGAIAARGGASVGSTDLQTMAMQRDRARQRREKEEKERRAALAGEGALAADRFPFEDFEVGVPARFGDGSRTIQRALTSGPGSYTLFIAWADASQTAAKATVHVARQSLQLAPAKVEFGLSSVIIADQIGVRPVPYTALEQRSHPYTIGVTDILPARDAIFAPHERLAVAFQIVNAMPSATGKPDIRVELRIVRMTGAREEPVAALSPLIYNDSTMPPDFDIRQGQPVIAALSAPLSTIPRGDYRLRIAAEDKLSGSIVSSAVDFRVIGTATSLLAEAPPLATRFTITDALRVPIVAALIDRLAPATPSPALSRALESARAGRFADLLIAEAVPEPERGVRAALTGLGLLSFADLGAIRQFEWAMQADTPPAPVHFLIGAARAMQNRDADAVIAWASASDGAVPKRVVDRLIADAYLRQKDFTRAASAIAETDDVIGDPAAARTLAATRIALRRNAEAVAMLDAALVHDPENTELRWLLVHALYARFVGGDRGAAERLRSEGARYVAGRGPHTSLLSAWLDQLN